LQQFGGIQRGVHADVQQFVHTDGKRQADFRFAAAAGHHAQALAMGDVDDGL